MTVRTVSGQRNLAFTAKDGVVTLRLDLEEADYVLLMRRGYWTTFSTDLNCR